MIPALEQPNSVVGVDAERPKAVGQHIGAFGISPIRAFRTGYPEAGASGRVPGRPRTSRALATGRWR
jgi:hypothetical protein